MKKYVIKNKLLSKILIVLLIFFVLGIMYISILSKINKDMIEKNLELFFSSINSLDYIKGLRNCLTSNLLYIIVIFILGISIVGIPLICLLLITKSFILGFTISSIIYFYRFKGIFIAVIYSIPLVFNLLLYLLLGYYGIIFSINLIKLLFMKKNIYFKNIVRKYTKILIFVTVSIILSSIVEIYLIPNILKLLQI